MAIIETCNTFTERNPNLMEKSTTENSNAAKTERDPDMLTLTINLYREGFDYPVELVSELFAEIQQYGEGYGADDHHPGFELGTNAVRGPMRRIDAELDTRSKGQAATAQ